MGKLYLEVSPDIRLYYPSPDFAPALFTLIKQQYSYLSTWMPWVKSIQSEEDMHRALKEQLRYNIGKQKLTTYIYVDDKIAGSVGLFYIDKEHKKAEIGYWLREDYQGRGIVTNSIKRLISYVFKTTNLNRLYMKIPAQNKKSSLIAIRLGFQFEGTLRQDAVINGIFHDMEIYSLLKAQWLEAV